MNREQFLKPMELTTKEVSFNGSTVMIRKLNKSELCQYQKWLRPKGELNESRYAERDFKLIMMSLSDESGSQLLKDDDWDALKELPGAEMDELAYEIMVLNGYALSEEDLLGKSGS